MIKYGDGKIKKIKKCTNVFWYDLKINMVHGKHFNKY